MTVSARIVHSPPSITKSADSSALYLRSPHPQVAAAVLTLASAACDGTRPWRGGLHGTFGWTTDMRYLPSIAWLAAGPGVLGHTSLAALLKWMHPLQVLCHLL